MKDVEGWQTKSLGTLINDIGDGGTPDTNKKENFGGTIPWVVIQDIRREISSTKTNLTSLGIKSCSAKLWPNGSIILSTGATIGEVGIANVPVSTKQGIHGIVCSERLSSNFLYYKLQTLRDFLNANAQGSTIREVRAPFLRTIPISFPTALSEQAKIAEILSTVDRAIEQTEALIAKQQRIKTGLMQDLLTHGIDEHGNLRSEETHEFKNSPLGRIPVEWEIVEAKKACSLITKGTTPKLRSAESQDFPIPYLRVQNLTFSNQINFSVDLEFISSAIHEGELARSKVLPGDVLQNIVGPPLGKVGVVPSDYPEWNINQAIAVFRPNEYVSSEFLCYWLQAPVTRAWFEFNSHKTSGQQNLTLEHCQQLPIMLPPMAEQSRICSLIEQMMILQRIEEHRFRKLCSLKTALMQDLLTGKKRVTALLNDTEVSS